MSRATWNCAERQATKLDEGFREYLSGKWRGSLWCVVTCHSMALEAPQEWSILVTFPVSME